MISIILAADDESKARAMAAGFRERTVLTRDERIGFEPMDDQKAKTEIWIMRHIKPFQFLVSGVWGAGPD